MFNNKPLSTVKLAITHIPTGWSTDYEFNIKKWGEPMTDTSHTLTEALTYCTTLFTKSELTNTPTEAYHSAQTRAIGTFTSEWGEMNTYSDSGIGWGFYWTSEQSDTINQYSVHLTFGALHPLLKTEKGSIFCKK